MVAMKQASSILFLTPKTLQVHKLPAELKLAYSCTRNSI
jgi:hypothetical protein